MIQSQEQPLSQPALFPKVSLLSCLFSLALINCMAFEQPQGSIETGAKRGINVTVYDSQGLIPQWSPDHDKLNSLQGRYKAPVPLPGIAAITQ